MTDWDAVGRRVATLRQKAGEGQHDLAAAIGKSRSTVAGIETGGDGGGTAAMVAIADHYKVPLDWLLCRKVPTGGPLVSEFVEDPDELALLHFWRGLDLADRQSFARTLRISPAAAWIPLILAAFRAA